MKVLVDAFDDAAPWTVNSPSTVTENEFPDYIAGLNDKSLLFFFDEDDTVRTATRTGMSVDVSAVSELVFSCFSINKQGSLFKQASDFYYTLTINGTREYYIATRDSMVDQTIWIGDISTITSLTITPQFATDDWILFSEMVAVEDELPLDIYLAAVEHVEKAVEELFGLGRLAGTLTGTAGDTIVSVDGEEPWLERYAVITIDDGSNREFHQLGDNNGKVYDLGSTFDGSVLLNDFAAADVYLKYPVTYGQWEIEILLPGIIVWNIVPEPILRGSKLEEVVDTYDRTNDDFKSRTEGQILRWDCWVDCEARMYENIADMTRAVRRFIQKEKIWINGRKHDIYFQGSPTEVVPTEAINVMPKAVYTFGIEIKEDVFDRVTLEKTTAINFTPVIAEQGGLPSQQ